MNKPIGIFDSGVGGISIYLAIKKVLPKESLYYLADQANCPYGDKPQVKIKKASFKSLSYLYNLNCKLIVIGCNTVTTNAIDYLRKKFPIPLVGVVPVVKPAVRSSKTGHFIILSTQATKKSKSLRKLINKFVINQKVYNLACSGLADLIEKGIIKGKKVKKLLKKSLKPALKDNSVDIIATGCTHYFFIKKSALSFFNKNVNFIEPSKPVAKQVKRVLIEKKILSNKKFKDRFFTTGNKKDFENSFFRLTGLKITAKKVKL